MTRQLFAILLLFCSSFSHIGDPQTVSGSSQGQSFFQNLSACLTCNVTDDWEYVLDKLGKYSAKHEWNRSDINIRITSETFFSKQLLYIAEYSANNRKESGGWAGEFVRISFLVAISDLERNPDNWNDDFLPMNGHKGVACSDLEKVAPSSFNPQFHLLCELFQDGIAHLNRHLKPAFNCYFSENLKLLLKTQSPKTRLDAIDLFLGKIEAEHEAFLKNAVVPGFVKLNKFWTSVMYLNSENWAPVFQVISESVVLVARKTRRDVLSNSLSNLLYTHQITLGEWNRLRAKYA